MAYAEQNFEATFDFAQKLMLAKDPTEIMRAAIGISQAANADAFTQVQDLGQSAAKIVMDAAKPKS